MTQPAHTGGRPPQGRVEPPLSARRSTPPEAGAVEDYTNPTIAPAPHFLMSLPSEPLILDIDLRLASLWADVVDDVELWDLDVIGNWLRCAYGMGYVEALKEVAAGRAGKLCVDHGYEHPLMEETT